MPTAADSSLTPRRPCGAPTIAARSWIRADEGLPQEDAYFTVLREAMARDTLEPVGVSFGTQTGQLWHSADGGERWRLVTADLPPIWAVEAVTIEG